MKVLVLYEQVENAVRFVMVARVGSSDKISPVVTITSDSGRVYDGSGNPYVVYGDFCAAFTNCDWRDLSISCFRAERGGLEGWL